MAKLYYYYLCGAVSSEPVPLDSIPEGAEQILDADNAHLDPPPWHPIPRARTHSPAPAPYPRHQYPPAVQTIEETGKIWKLHMIAALCVALLGLYIIGSGVGGGGIFLTIAFLYLVFAKCMAWWHHG